MKQFKQILRKISKYQSNKQTQLSLRKYRKDWWTPIWKGLASDHEGKHRKAMGISLWTYFYLLTFTNRMTGIVRKNPKVIAQEMGLPLRTIQRHLKRLKSHDYIVFLNSEHYPKIRIKKWKLFNGSEVDDK